jgi:hypothetical protein
MEGTWDTIRTVPVSTTRVIGDIIELVRARTLSITARIDFETSCQDDATINLYYSADGNHWDTLPYATQDITASAGNTVQKTFIVDPPEHGYITGKIVNNSAADTLTNVKLWYSIQAWLHYKRSSVGDISTQTMRD